ncbi:hypothetical protein OHA21_14380 [Actinoplanes sp. NBC_00393]|uniref:hypothetical protein n=1 Tax=Actinoplanes sp. NBC_00393 TaxID=2975953 RepID=UPI002E2487D6
MSITAWMDGWQLDCDPERAAGSGLITPVQEARKWVADCGDRRFAGFLMRAVVVDET